MSDKRQVHYSYTFSLLLPIKIQIHMSLAIINTTKIVDSLPVDDLQRQKKTRLSLKNISKELKTMERTTSGSSFTVKCCQCHNPVHGR